MTKSNSGGINISYGVGYKNQLVDTWTKLHVEIISRNIIRYIFKPLNQNKMKQTAVMIVENKVEAEATALFDGELTFSEFMYNINKHFNRALEMEKKQIENAFNQGFSTPQWDKEKENKAEQYYEKTFKSE